MKTLCATIPLLVAGVMTFGPATSGAQVPDRISTPVLRETPASAVYLDPVFEFSRTHEDLVYGGNYDYKDVWEDLLLDVWQPVGHDAEDRPAVVWISGGGFTHHNKAGLLPYMSGLLRRGYVVASITYRVRPETGPGSFERILDGDPVEFTEETIGAMQDANEDAKAAVRWMRANAATLRIDPERIAVAGWSAGAFTALGVAFDYEDPGESNDIEQPSHVAAAISGAGGYGPVAVGRMIQPGDPPVQIFHGTHDTVVPIFASALPCSVTLAMGNVCEAHVYPGGDHGLAPWRDHFVEETASFLYRHVVAPESFP